MNRLVIYTRNLFSNIFRFANLAVKKEDIFWDYLSINIVDCKIDKEAKIHGFCSLTNVSVGKGSYITFNAKISNTSIGKFCSIGPNLFCGWGVHPLNGISTSPAFYSTKKQNGFTFSETDKVEERKPIQIGNDVFIGANVTILDGVTIGDGAVIGAGSVVSKDIPAYAVAVGCPIEVIKYRFEKKIIESLLDYRWWDKDENVLRRLEKNFFNVEQFLENSEKQ